MLKLFKKLHLLLFGRPTEIQLVEAALIRYRHELFDMQADFDPRYDCCQECKYGSRYCKLQDKIERVEKQLIRLKRNKNKKIKEEKRRRLWMPL